MSKLPRNLLMAAIGVLALAGNVVGQTQFAQNPPLYFTMAVGGQNPLPQILPLASTSKDFTFGSSQPKVSSGNWLQTSGCSTGTTPSSCVVAVNGANLTAGVYTGQLPFTMIANSPPLAVLNVTVTLTVVAYGTPFPGGAPGGLNFVSGSGYLPASQTFPIVSGTPGTLNWTAAAISPGGTWLNISNSSGSAPFQFGVGVSAQGLLPGTYVGEILIQTPVGNLSVPVTLTVVDSTTSTFAQMSGLNFIMPEGGFNPMPQVLTIASTAADFDYSQPGVFSGAGGNFLSITGCTVGDTTSSCTVVVTAPKLGAGIYGGQVVLTQINSTGSKRAMTVPVVLRVVTSDLAFHGGVTGAINFIGGNGSAPVAQSVAITNAGSGTLNWTANGIVFRTGGNSAPNWLSVSPASGTGQSQVLINASAAGLSPGTYLAQVVLGSSAGSVTVPVSLLVPDSATVSFQQMPALNFVMTAGGSNPLSQILTAASTGTDFSFSKVSAWTASGGNWLVLPNCDVGVTPANCVVSVNAPTLAPGKYSGEVVFARNNIAYAARSAVASVTLTVTEPAVPSFSGVPGGISFVSGNGFLPAQQMISLTTTGGGVLNWSAAAAVFRNSLTTTTSWLTVSPDSGTSPSQLTVSATATSLQPGTYLGQITLSSPSGTVTIPVRLVVLDSTVSTFEQLPSYNFSMSAGGTNPLSQVLSVISTGNALSFNAPDVQTASGGGWLSVTNPFGGPAPYVSTLSIDGANLAAGIYNGQILFNTVSNDFDVRSLLVPVTLTVVPSGRPGFGGIPGQLDFVSGNGFTPAPQAVQVTTTGGSFNWTAATSISRTNNAGTSNWLTVSPGSGNAPSQFTASVNPQGLAPGTYLGQITLQSGSAAVTIPVSLVVLDTTTRVFQQPLPLLFSMPVGGPVPPSQITTAKSTGAPLSITSGFYYNAGWLKATGCNSCSTPQTYTASVLPNTLPAGIYQSQIYVATSSTAAVTPVILTIGDPLNPAPAINPGGIVPVYSSVNTIQPGEWISIYGSNLAASTTIWNGDFPTSLGGTSVTINGKAAYLWLVSSGQINLQAPDDSATGQVPVVVTTPNGSFSSTVTLSPAAPSFSLLDGKHVTGIILRGNGSGAYGGGTYDIIGPTGGALGYPTVAAAPGDSVVFFCVGLGPTSPVVLAGHSFSGAAATVNRVTVTINGTSVPVSFAGLSSAGLYQINVTLPAGLGTGDVSLQASVGSARTPPGALISLR